MRLYAACGPKVITVKNWARVFRFKVSRYPNTVASTAEVVTSYGVDMFNLHLAGGSDDPAWRERPPEPPKRIPSPLVIGVTVLTSFDEKALREEASGKLSSMY